MKAALRRHDPEAVRQQLPRFANVRREQRKRHGFRAMVVPQRGKAGLEGKPRAVIVRVKPGSQHPFDASLEHPEVMAIGHSNKSATFVPSVEHDPNLQLTFVDCPGFLDNRGAEINIANAVNIKRTVAGARSVRVVVLINYSSLEADRGRGVKELVKILRDLFGGQVGRLVRNAGAVLVGVCVGANTLYVNVALAVFPVRSRGAGFGLAYNLAMFCFAAPAPLVNNFLRAEVGTGCIPSMSRFVIPALVMRKANARAWHACKEMIQQVQ